MVSGIFNKFVTTCSNNNNTNIISTPPKNVVITGSTKGIGKEVARKMLSQGHNVIITSSNPSNVYSTYREFKTNPDYSGKCYPMIADVSSYEDCSRLLRTSLHVLGDIDIWMNNAGVSYRNEITELTENEINKIIQTNLVGTIFCCKVVIPQMVNQKKGIIINFEGAGSNGFGTPLYSVYGSTKCGISQFTRSLQHEYSDSNIHFCTISPGMVVTELLLRDANNQCKKMFNIFCENADHVAEYLVSEIHKIEKNTNIRYLTINRMIILMFMSLFRRNRFFDSFGNRKF